MQVYFAEQPAEVIYSGSLAQFPGLWQVNARVPTRIAGQVSIFLSSDTLASSGATLWVK